MRRRSAWLLLERFRRWSRLFYSVPWCVPGWGLDELKHTAGTILTGSVTKGPHVDRFVHEIKERLQVRYAVPVNKGRTAIEIALRGMNIRSGDEVILPSYLCTSVLEAVVRTHASPVFADVDRDLHLTSRNVEEKITSRTKCVIVPHLFGRVAPVDEIESLLAGSGIALIDDAAQSFGSRLGRRPIGSFGTCGIVSCGLGKPLAGAAGAALVTSDPALYKKAMSINLPNETMCEVLGRVASVWVWRRYRKYTLPLKELLDRFAENKEEAPYIACRMSNLDAAIGLQQLRALEKNNARRHANALVLHRLLDASGYSIAKSSDGSPMNKFVLVLQKETDVDAFINAAAENGIECQKGYRPLHILAGKRAISLPVTEEIWDRVVCIPLETKFKAGMMQPLQSHERGNQCCVEN